MNWVLIILAVLIGAIVVSAAGAFGVGFIYAVPIALILIGGAVATLVGGRSVLRTRRHHERIRRFREQARPQTHDYTAADRRTLV
jgi:uncharacterized membrane protein YfcA